MKTLERNIVFASDEEVLLDFMPGMDDTYILVLRYLPNGSREPLGSITKEYNKEKRQAEYFACDCNGKEILPANANIAEVERGFEAYARMIIRRETREKELINLRQRLAGKVRWMER